MEWVKKGNRRWVGYINDEPAYEVGYNRENGWYYTNLDNDCGADGYGTATEAKRMAEQDSNERFNYELEIRMETRLSNLWAESVR